MESSRSTAAAIKKWMQILMHRSMQKFILFAKENNISMSQFGALQFIKHRGACGVSDIGDELGISSAAASQMLDRMVQQELIQRTEDAKDRRSKQIILIEKGQLILQESIRARISWIEELSNLLSPAEQEQVIAALNLLISKAEQMDNPIKRSINEPE